MPALCHAAVLCTCSFYLGSSNNWKICSDSVCDRMEGKALQKTMPEDVCNPKGGKKGDADRW
jgi:hypothetical protein